MKLLEALASGLLGYSGPNFRGLRGCAFGESNGRQGRSCRPAHELSSRNIRHDRISLPRPAYRWVCRAQFLSVFLRHHDVVALRLNMPDCHHGVVLMHHVMAVNWVLAQPVAEAEE